MSASKTDKTALLTEQSGSVQGPQKSSKSTLKVILVAFFILIIFGGIILALYFTETFPFDSDDDVDDNRVTTNDIRELRTLMFDFFETTTNSFGDREPKIGTLVRLTFHDCAGPPIFNFTDDDQDSFFDESRYPFDAQSVCDGCIDFANLANHANLEKDIIEPIEEIYQSGFDKKMSRADFWATCGILALERAAFNQNTGNAAIEGPKARLPDLPFVFGRVDCPTSPDADEGTFKFPVPTFGWDDTREFFERELNLTIRETVTLLGAHSLGRAHQNNSGFKNRWVGQEHVLNHAFYVALIEQHENRFGWTQRRVNRTGNLQWMNSLGVGPPQGQDGQLGSPNIRLMFNSDVSLKSRLAENVIDEEGRVNCSVSEFAVDNTFPLCEEQPDTIEIIREFAGDAGRGTGDQSNRIWIREFRAVYQKMILTGYPDFANDEDFYTVDGGRTDVTTTTTQPN